MVKMRNTDTTCRYLSIAYKVLGCVIPCAILLALGTWQVCRLKEKLLIIQRADLEPVTLPVPWVNEYSYRKVRLRGVFEKSYLKVFAGKNGYYLVQPIRTAENTYVLVNRGTFSADDVTIAVSPEIQEVEGTVHCKLSNMTKWVIRNSPKQNLWFWYDIDEMSRHLGISLEKCIIWGNGTAALDSIKPNAPLKIRNDHLGYAITWYVLALTWACGYVVYVRRQ